MSKNKENVHELLDYKDTHAPWFMFDENQPYAQLLQNLKLLRRLNKASNTSPEELDRVTEQEIKAAVLTYNAKHSQNPPIPVPPATASQFFHSRIAQSLYTSDIIPFFRSSQQNTASPNHTSQHVAPQIAQYPNTSPTTAAEPIHGFQLN